MAFGAGVCIRMHILQPRGGDFKKINNVWWIIAIAAMAFVAFIVAWMSLIRGIDDPALKASPARKEHGAAHRSDRNNDRYLHQRWLLLYTGGVGLLALVVLTPHSGYGDWRSFLAVAQASPWSRWWDWAAAWCSLKLILASLGVFALLAAFSSLLDGYRRKWLANAVLLLGTAPGAVFWLGAYYLVKALL
jgi:hypothetical protein